MSNQHTGVCNLAKVKDCYDPIFGKLLHVFLDNVLFFLHNTRATL